ncbi:MAG: helix-turn-helix domain-containing protein, partial [Magnetococcales bacterium]|nr:helix-turn-helix domain-containing protein [Magnetococcales bacterium]
MSSTSKKEPETLGEAVALARKAGGGGHADYARMGDALRRYREELGLSLEEMSRRTRIRETHLLAIEEGRPDAMPARVFAIGFMRLYARTLEFPGMEQVEACLADMDGARQALQNESFVASPAPRHRPTLLLAVIGLLVLGALFGAYEYHIAEISKAVGLPAPPNAAPLRVGEVLPPRSPTQETAPLESVEETAVAKPMGQDDPSLWPATDSSPEKVTLMASDLMRKPEPKPESKPEVKPEPKPKPEVKPEPKPETKPKPEVKPESKPEPKPKPEVKPEPKPEVKPAPKPEAKPVSQPDAKAQAAQEEEEEEEEPENPPAKVPASLLDRVVGWFMPNDDAAKAGSEGEKEEVTPDVVAALPGKWQPETAPTPEDPIEGIEPAKPASGKASARNPSPEKKAATPAAAPVDAAHAKPPERNPAPEKKAAAPAAA